MGLPVPDSTSPRSPLMWVNFPPAPRKSAFPVPPGTGRGFKQDEAGFGGGHLGPAEQSGRSDRVSAGSGWGMGWLGTGDPFGSCNPRLEIDLRRYQKSLPRWPLLCRARPGKGWECTGLRMEVLTEIKEGPCPCSFKRVPEEGQ